MGCSVNVKLKDIRGYILTGKNLFQFSLLIWNSFISQLVHLVGGDGIGKGMDGGIVILASCEHQFIAHIDLVQHPRLLKFLFKNKCIFPFAKSKQICTKQ